MKIPLILLITLGAFALSSCSSSSGRNQRMNEYYDYYMSWPDCDQHRTTNCWNQRN